MDRKLCVGTARMVYYALPNGGASGVSFTIQEAYVIGTSEYTSLPSPMKRKYVATIN